MDKTYESFYASLIRQAAAEGIVLLKNDRRLLPLKKGTVVASFGRDQFNYYKSGTGSGGLVNAPYTVSVLDALKSSPELCVDGEISALYERWIENNPPDTGDGWTRPTSQKEMPLGEAEVAEAAKRCDAAIISIGRVTGEEKDNTPEAGGYLLSPDEEAMLRLVCGHFKNTVVLLNTGGIIDMKWVSEFDPTAVLYIWQGGQEGGNAAADILTGRVSPSGRLPDTVALDIGDYPSTQNFGDAGENVYAEDIFVGYRYFETFARDKVLYPFGFGLSYTEFEYSPGRFRVTDEGVEAEIEVKNVGDTASKEVVQLYASQPCGKLGKSARVLCAFAKTAMLAPGESETVFLTCALSELASFDDTGRSGHPFCFVLEAGEYGFFTGGCVRCTQKVGGFTLPETRVIEKLHSAQAPVKTFERLVCRDGEAAYEPVPTRDYDLWQRVTAERPAELIRRGETDVSFADVIAGRASVEDFTAQLPAQELCVLVRGEGMNSPKVTPGTGAAFGGLSPYLRKLGVPVACCTDGPSGLRMDSGATAFSLPNGTCLAAGFNEKLSTELFECVALEMRKNRIDILLGPGLNTHRNPLNGRNFEYFSEDPLLTGMMAAAQLKGLHRHGVLGAIKHFEANSQEYCRRFANGVISQRAQREIYLKGFELCIRYSGARCVMSSYGPVNGIWNASSYDLLTTVLRNEWGFDGFVMSDWWAHGNEEGEPPSKQEVAAMVRSGNDIYMVNNDAQTNSNNDNLMPSLGMEKLTLGELQLAACNILRALLALPTTEISIGAEKPEYAQLREDMSLPDIHSRVITD